MTFAADESSVQESEPIALIDFAAGATHWRQCSGPAAITYGGQSYSAQPGLKVGATEDSGNYLRSTCEISCEWGNPFVKLYPATPPDAIVTVDVYIQQPTGTSPWWSGYVADVQRRDQKKREASILCVASFSLLGNGSRVRRCGRVCQAPLYSSGRGGCGLTQGDWDAAGTITAVSGTTVSAAVFATQADGWWTGGPITINGYSRMVLDHTGSTVEISESVPGAAVGQAVTVAAGCDHKFLTCQNKFSNGANNQGCPGLPTGRNAFTQGVY